jgi:hypothetical protein
MHLNNQRQCTPPPKMSQLDTSCEIGRPALRRPCGRSGFPLARRTLEWFLPARRILESSPELREILTSACAYACPSSEKSLPRLAVTLARAAKNQYLGFLTRILQSLTVPAYGGFCANNTPVSLLPLHMFLAYLCATHASAESSVPTRDLSAWAGGTWLPRSAS